MVQEYERAVIFRLGRLLSGGAKGPGEIVVFVHVVRCNYTPLLDNRWLIPEFGNYWAFLILIWLGDIYLVSFKHNFQVICGALSP